MDDDFDLRAAMLRTGVRIPDDPPPATEDETMVADALSLTVEEVRFTRRHGVTPEKYAASKSVHSLASFEVEMRRRRAEGNDR